MKRIVFCDFDGTITVAETFVAMADRFTPEVAARLRPQIYSQQITLREGVRQTIESIPSAKYPEIIEFIRSQPIREGFGEFLDFLQTENIPIVVISGGLQIMVETALTPYRDRITAIHAIELDTTGEYLQPSSRYASGTEYVAKAKIMADYGADETIAIGDGITDWQIAEAADLVFALPPLTKYLDERSKPYLSWTDFHDIRTAIAQRIGVA